MTRESIGAISASGMPWFAIDGWGPGERSYAGVAREVLVAERGREFEFLESLRAPSGRGGWVFALSYEFGAALLGLAPVPSAEAPGFAMRVDSWEDARVDQNAIVAEARGGQSASDAASGSGAGAGSAGAGSAGPWGELWRSSARDYRSQVRECLRHIREGDAYVLCLTDTAEVAASPDPLRLYQTLCRARRPLRGGLLMTGERALIGASPERFLSVRDGRVRTHPMKGTRPRATDPVADAAQAEELGADPKERAENLMIVDLMRNDLSRVCAPNSIAVTDFLRVESHPHVHQLVSTVEGDLRPGLDALDALAACFPGGSMTGAPKRRAVEILRRLERGPRGLYAGCFGWIADNGDAELAMTIRSVELSGRGTGAEFARVGSGGGITADSDPRREAEEKLLKAAPLIGALREVGAESVRD